MLEYINPMNLGNKILYFAMAVAVVLTVVALLVYYLVLDKDEGITLDVQAEEEILKSLTSTGPETLSQEEIKSILKTLTADEN